MPEPLPGPVVAVIGPTGVGKTEIADALATHFGGEIVSADSMQVYRGMDIGTAKRPSAQRAVPYHCIDLVDAGTPYSAARYQRDARAAMDDILARGRVPVLVGGTGLYVRAAVDDLAFPGGRARTPERERIERLAEQVGPEALHAMLAVRDPAAAAVIHPNNVRRVVRALEVLDGEGTSYATRHAAFRERRAAYRTVMLGLTMDRASLYEAIDARVDRMMGLGLLDEVRGLLSRKYRSALTAAQAIGYKELVPVLEEGADLASAVAAVKQATRRYAKRQLTWFRADPRIVWLDVTGLAPDAAVDAARSLVQSGLAA